MSRLSLWRKQKGNDYNFIDRTSAEQFTVGGVSVYIHKYIGPYTEEGINEEEAFLAPKNINQAKAPETWIQDLLFMENRDRKYDPHIYELRGHFTVQDNDFDLSQFGLMLSNDNIYITFHLNTMIDQIGRKLMSGDVVELPNMREDAMLDDTADAINKFYVIDDANYAAEGYSPLWYRHLWRCTCKPLKDSPEFRDILGTGEKKDDLKNLLSTYAKDIALSDLLIEAAEAESPMRNFETAHFYVIPGDDSIGRIQQPSIWSGDGKPPNGAEPVGSGKMFPSNAHMGDYFLRTDYEPHVLYKKEKNGWSPIEVDYRSVWRSAHRILESFVGSTDSPDQTWVDDKGKTVTERQNLKKAIKPRSDV